PVDVEVGGVLTRRAVLQHVPPPAVPAGDGHVVGDDVEHLPEPGVAQGGAHALMAGGAAELVVDPAVVDDVVAVGGTGRGLAVGRRIEVAHAQAGQVGGDSSGGVEPE